jgi:tripeptidyl-peptidase-1
MPPYIAGINNSWADNQFGTVDGTSCSTPTFASIIALLNDEASPFSPAREIRLLTIIVFLQLVAAGRPVLGFLNPFLYSPGGRAALNDVTSGTNPGCGTKYVLSFIPSFFHLSAWADKYCSGFSASAGWDPITGLGTPNYAALRTALGL